MLPWMVALTVPPGALAGSVNGRPVFESCDGFQIPVVVQFDNLAGNEECKSVGGASGIADRHIFLIVLLIVAGRVDEPAAIRLGCRQSREHRGQGA